MAKNRPFKDLLSKFPPSHISICHFTDHRKPHYHVVIPISDDNALVLTILITSQIEKREKLFELRKESEPIGVYVEPSKKGFTFLRHKSLIDIQNQMKYEWSHLCSLNVELIECDIDENIVENILMLIVSSRHTKKSIKEAIELKYSIKKTKQQ